MNNLEIITKENPIFGEVRFTIIDDKEYAVANDVAKALGYADPKSTISKKCKGVAKIATPTNGGTQQLSYIPESDIYRLIFGSKLPNAEQFQDWVFEEVLPTIRKNGAYISDNGADQDYLKFAYGQIEETFKNASIESLPTLYKEAIEFYSKNENKLPYYKTEVSKKKSNKLFNSNKKESLSSTKLTIMNKIKTSLLNRKDILESKQMYGSMSDLQRVIDKVSNDIKTLNDNVNRGKLASANRKIKEMQKRIEEIKQTYEWLNPSLESGYYNELPIHAFSYNCAKKFPGTFRKWKEDFPIEYVWSKETWEEYFDVDFTKPIKIIIKNVNQERLDTDNLEKATVDRLFYDVFGVDDNIVKNVECATIGHCDTFEDGKIYYYLRNMTDEEINEEANKEQGDN